MWIFDIDNQVPYDKTITMAGKASITSAQHSQLESNITRNIKNYEKLLGANSAARYLITGAIDSNLIASVLRMSLVMKNILPSISSSSSNIACASSLTTEKKLKLQAKFTTPWNLDKKIVAQFLFLKKKQDKLLKWKVPCDDAAMVIQPFIKWRSATTSTTMIWTNERRRTNPIKHSP